MDYMFKKMFSKNRINIKNIKYLYQYLIINPFVSIIKNEHYKCYTKEVLEYVSSKTRLDYIFKDCDWGDLFDNDKVNTLNSVFEYFELCNNFDLAMYCYNMCREYQRKVFSDKLFGLFWKEKNLEFAKNKKVYNFYLKSITDLGVYGERSLIRLNKYLKDN